MRSIKVNPIKELNADYSNELNSIILLDMLSSQRGLFAGEYEMEVSGFEFQKLSESQGNKFLFRMIDNMILYRR